MRSACPVRDLREHAGGHDPGPCADLAQWGQDAVRLGERQDATVNAARA